MSNRVIMTDTIEQTANIFGSFDMNIAAVEKAYGVSISNRDSEQTLGNVIVISGEDDEAVAKAGKVVEYLKKMSVLNDEIGVQNVEYVISMVNEGSDSELKELDDDCICITMRGKPIKAKTVGQRKYVDAIKKNTIVLGVGPAGTGKTFLAVAMAVTALRNKEIQRIILTRPAVEAGEKLGFLPGDLQNKIDPYLRPLYDALYEMLGAENYQRHLERGTIEVAPLAYMRGRTLDDAFIILDEAQNTSPEQMKMFLTRLGFNSKAVVTGDVTQIDLGFRQKSGLVEAIKVLNDINGIEIFHFSEKDVVRHRLVQKIIEAYGRYEREKAEGNENKTQRFYRK
ncbi:MAG: phosphate starvation-inducible protein PhoH [Ruminococcaceae bacterium]|nr:phosphate starvation-inducible protein PhoH [Oscillospiraceae bacterium]